MSEIINRKRNTPTKQRSQKVYDKKVTKIIKWHEALLKEREIEKINENTKQPIIRKLLKPLEFYLEKIKKPMGENK